MIFAFLVRFLLHWTFAMLSFWNERASAFERLLIVPYLFLSGLVAPLETFPEALRSIVFLTPYPYLLYFPAKILSGSDVNVPKPAPDLFLYAAKKMGFNPNECVVIEDSVTGVTAAVNANIRVYGIINNLFSEEDLEGAGAIPFTKMEELPELLGL